MSTETLTSAEYIHHHLQNLTFGRLEDGSWGIAHGAAEAKAMGFWAVHLDTLGFSIALGLIFLYFFRKAARQATAGVPGGWQNFVEWTVEFVEDSVKGSFSGATSAFLPLKEPLTLSSTNSTIHSTKFCNPPGTSAVACRAALRKKYRNRMPRPMENAMVSRCSAQKPMAFASATPWAIPHEPSGC